MLSLICYTESMSNSSDYKLNNLRPYIVALMTDEGRITDQSICEYCLELIPDNKWEIHHTKYQGATYQDLLLICRSCNRIGENVGLS